MDDSDFTDDDIVFERDGAQVVIDDVSCTVDVERGFSNCWERF